MKKMINFIIAVILTLFVSESFGQNNWIEIPYPPNSSSDFIVMNDTIFSSIYGDTGYFFSNLGSTWVKFLFLGGNKESINKKFVFKNRIYAAGLGKIYRSNGGNYNNWTVVVSDSVDYWSLTANADYIFAFGYTSGTFQPHAIRSSDGVNWEIIIMPGTWIFINTSFTMGSSTVVAMNNLNTDGLDQELRSDDNGLSWYVADTLLINSLAADGLPDYSHVIAGIYSATPGIFYPKFIGTYPGYYNQEGSVQGAKFFKGHCYVTIGFSYSPSKIVMDGDTTNAFTVLYMDYLWGIDHSQNVCVAWSSNHLFMLDYPTGVHEKKEQAIKLYPNPTTGIVNINVDSSEKMEITVYNLLGTTLGHYDLTNDHNVINLSNFPTGIYLIKFSNGITQKVLKQ